MSEEEPTVSARIQTAIDQISSLKGADFLEDRTALRKAQDDVLNSAINTLEGAQRQIQFLRATVQSQLDRL